MGGGAALFDMDNDGYLDLYLVQSGSLTRRSGRRSGNRLYRNRGNGTFEDVTDGAAPTFAATAWASRPATSTTTATRTSTSPTSGTTFS